MCLLSMESKEPFYQCAQKFEIHFRFPAYGLQFNTGGVSHTRKVSNIFG